MARTDIHGLLEHLVVASQHGSWASDDDSDENGDDDSDEDGDEFSDQNSDVDGAGRTDSGQNMEVQTVEVKDGKEFRSFTNHFYMKEERERSDGEKESVLMSSV